MATAARTHQGRIIRDPPAKQPEDTDVPREGAHETADIDIEGTAFDSFKPYQRMIMSRKKTKSRICPWSSLANP